MFIPRSRISFIANFVNHGKIDNTTSGFTREGEVYDKDPNKPTYFYNSMPHNGTDICIQKGYPIIAWKDNLVFKETTTTTTGGISAYVYDADIDRLYGFTHLSAVPMAVERKLSVGEIIAFTGDTGSLCGEPHIHFSIYKGDKKDLRNLLDICLLPEFQDLYSFIPYSYRTKQETAQWKNFQPSYKLYINGSFEHINRKDNPAHLIFHSNKKLEGIYHTGKIVYYGDELIKEFYGDTKEITGIMTETDRGYELDFNQHARQGVYYYQGKTPSGWTVPARIIVI